MQQGRWIWAAAAIAALAAPVAAQEAARLPPNTITVSGSGEAKAAPDVAYVTVGVVTDSRRAQDAAQANAKLSQQVMAALRQVGIAEKDLQTSNYSVSARYQPTPRGDGQHIGYQVSNQIRATVRRLDNVGKTLDAALEAGANSVQGVGFGLEARGKAEQEALAGAVANARRKAETLARAAGVSLGGVLQINEGGFVRPVPMFAGGEAMAFRAASTPVATGELSVSAQVNMVFALLGRAGAAPAPSRQAAAIRRVASGAARTQPARRPE